MVWPMQQLEKKRSLVGWLEKFGLAVNLGIRKQQKHYSCKIHSCNKLDILTFRKKEMF
jgi:hypothetical protein